MTDKINELAEEAMRAFTKEYMNVEWSSNDLLKQSQDDFIRGYTAAKDKGVVQDGVKMIADERQRQVEKEEWSLEHDDSHIRGELKDAALYALTRSKRYSQTGFEDFEMSMREKWKDGKEVRLLSIAGALIAAEIDRIKRIKS